MTDQTIIPAMQEAAHRVFGWQAQHGIFAAWDLHYLGLRLTANRGPDRIERIVSWIDLGRSKVAPGRLLELAERSALHGLSS
jgi:hypothetical protein